MGTRTYLESSLKKMELAAENDITKTWRENWLPLHEENPLIPKEHAVCCEYLTQEEEYVGMTEEEALNAFWKKEDAKSLVDMDEISQLKPETVLQELKKLRNFLVQDEELSSGELNLLKPGHIMLYKVDIPQHYFYFCSVEESNDGAVTFCFVKEKYGITMHVLGEHRTTGMYPFGFKNWIYRTGKTVVFSVLELCVHRIEFNSVEDAMKFEFQFMFLAEFSDKCAVLRLRGDFPEQQLLARGFEGEFEYKELHLRILHEAVGYNPDDETRSRPLKISYSMLMQNVLSKISDYVKNAYVLQIFLFKCCMSFHLPEEIQRLLDEILKDFKTLLKIAVFCVLPPKSPVANEPVGRSIHELVEEIIRITENLVCCEMMCRTDVLYKEYLQKFDEILNRINRHISKYENEDALVQEIADLGKEVADQGENEKESELDLISKMKDYLESGKPEILELFYKLDKILRVGETNIFDILCKNMKTELVQVLFHTQTVESVRKDFFGDRYANVETDSLHGEVRKNLVRLSDLGEVRGLFHYENLNILSLGEDLVQRKVYETGELLQNFTKDIERVLNFNFTEWLNLVSIWRKLGTENEEYLDVLSEMDSQTTRSSGEQPSHSSDNSYEKVAFPADSDCFVFPSAWEHYHKYERKKFEKIRKLGEGAYGCAKILKHENWRKVVLKKYSYRTTAAERTKEIDMLIRLQSNPHIVKLFGFYYSYKTDFGLIPDGILLEYIERNLHLFIHDRKGQFFKYNYIFKTAIEQMQGMASAFSAMHKQRIMHRDIKPDNILLTYGDQIKVCDLGMCGSIDKASKTRQQIGTPQYNSPEIHDGLKNYTEKVDVFSLGVTMWEQVHRRIPYCNFEKNSDFIDFVCDGNRLDFDEDCLPELKNIIQKAWAQDPNERPSMEELDEMLGTLLNSLSQEDLDEDVHGPIVRRIVDGTLFYEDIGDLK